MQPVGPQLKHEPSMSLSDVGIALLQSTYPDERDNFIIFRRPLENHTDEKRELRR